jgi:hypothetical protein
MKLPRGVWMILLGATSPVANVQTPGHGACALALPAREAHNKDAPSAKMCARDMAGIKDVGIGLVRIELSFFIFMIVFQPVMRIGRLKLLKNFLRHAVFRAGWVQTRNAARARESHEGIKTIVARF